MTLHLFNDRLSAALAFVAGLLFSVSGFCGEFRAPDFSLSTRIQGEQIEIIAHPPAHHHFNVQAPMSLVQEGGRVKPAQATEARVRFSVSRSHLRSDAHVSLYLCDDRKTFCENHQVRVTAPGNSPSPEPRKSGSSKPGAPSAKPQVLDATGFYLNDPQAAFSQARKQNKPLLIEFFTIWCPSCNILDRDVLRTVEFNRAAEPFVKLKLDGDVEASWELKSHYRIRAYPTVLFVAPEGDEILRIVGSRSKADFISELKRAWSSRANPLPVLKAKALAGDKGAADQVGSIYFERGEYEEAIPFLKSVPERREQFLRAEIGAWEQKREQSPEAESQYRAALKAYLEAFPKRYESLDYRMKLASVYGADEKSAILKEGIAVAEELLKNSQPNGDFTDADVWSELAEFQQSLGENDKAKAAWKRAAGAYAAKAASPGQWGYTLESAYCLWKSGDFEGADRIYRALQKEYPREFTFYYARVSMNFERKSLKPATRDGLRALKYSYGDHRLRAALLLARIYQADGKTALALATVRRALDERKVEGALLKDPSLRTHRYLKALRDFEASLPKAQN
ncbi:MAG TPA: thioredoxin family protein [Bdellovibrionota bacterium]|nr:thioredoxin family protein [Bdellovibrionota bacterium]